MNHQRFYIDLLFEEGFCLLLSAARHIHQVILGDIKAANAPDQRHQHRHDNQPPEPFEQTEGFIGRKQQKQRNQQGADASQDKEGLPQRAFFKGCLIKLLHHHQDAAACDQPDKDGE